MAISSQSAPMDSSAIHANNQSTEGEDSFPADNNRPQPGVLLDMSAMSMISNSARPGPASVATTELASAVGSVVGDSKDAFLKSITFYKDINTEWAINFENRTKKQRGFLNRNKQRLYIDTVGGLITFSRIQSGDYLKSINGRKIGPSMNAERALQRMRKCLNENGVLCIATANKELGDDILVQATVIKPRPDMTYEEMGMEVWMWGFLCVRRIQSDSIFGHSCLQESDNIVSVNDIQCETLEPEQFAEILNRLPCEVTITILRRKERWGGDFK